MKAPFRVYDAHIHAYLPFMRQLDCLRIVDEITHKEKGRSAHARNTPECRFSFGVQVQCSQALCRRNRVPMLDFAETAEFSFQAGPERIRKYARLFGVVTNVIICFVHFQAVVIYVLYVATSFQQV